MEKITDQYISAEEKRRVEKELKKYGLDKDKIQKAKKEIVELYSKNKEVPKIKSSERNKIDFIKICYNNYDEQDPELISGIFRIHCDLLNSANPKVKGEALKLLGTIRERYRIGLFENLK